VDAREAPLPSPGGLNRDKAALRDRLLAARRQLTAAERAGAGRGIRDAILSLPETQMAGTVAAYYSVGTEPETHGLLFALWKRGSYVLLPILLPDGDLDWASYEGPDSLRPGPRGLSEPAEPPRAGGGSLRHAARARRRQLRPGAGPGRNTGAHHGVGVRQRVRPARALRPA
jgi:5-formyltetrahydrofolate cyclo-ligase family